MAEPYSTENDIQLLLASKFNRSGSLCVPNCGVFGWEADLVRITRTLIASEYEIKISRADFRADANKYWKRISLETDGEGSRRAKGATPSRFWYVAPRGVIPPDEIPEFAGLIEIVWSDLVPRVKAPRLHNKRVSLEQMLFVTRGAALRYWDHRRAQKELASCP